MRYLVSDDPAALQPARCGSETPHYLDLQWSRPIHDSQGGLRARRATMAFPPDPPTARPLRGKRATYK